LVGAGREDGRRRRAGDIVVDPERDFIL